MTTYTALLRVREVRALMVSYAVLVMGASLGGLALGTLVNAETGSPLLTAAAMFGPTLANVVGAATAMSLADSRRPRRTLIGLQVAATLLVVAQLVPGVPVAGRLALVVTLGLVMSVATGLRMGVLAEAVGEASYATARSLMNIANGSMQVLAFGLGSILLTWFTPRQLFLLDASALAVSTIVIATGVREHSARPTARPGLAQTVRTNAWLLRQRRLRPLLVSMWVPNGLVVGCEALFIPFAGDRAGTLFMAGALGMLAGDAAMGRFVGRERRRRLCSWLRLLLAAPYVAFVTHPSLLPATLLVVVASLGYGGGLAMQERLVELTPPAVRGQVQGVESAGRMTMQGVGALLAGSLAEVLPAHVAMALVAALSLAVTLATMRGVRRAFEGPLVPA